MTHWTFLPSVRLSTVSGKGLSGFKEDEQNPDAAAGTFSPLGPAAPGAPSVPGKPGRPWLMEEEENGEWVRLGFVINWAIAY